jgi:hypothetical protein
MMQPIDMPVVAKINFQNTERQIRYEIVVHKSSSKLPPYFLSLVSPSTGLTEVLPSKGGI